MYGKEFYHAESSLVLDNDCDDWKHLKVLEKIITQYEIRKVYVQYRRQYSTTYSEVGKNLIKIYTGIFSPF